MSTLALTLTDFQKQVPFSKAIEDGQIRPHIQNTYSLDLVPLLGFDTLEAVDSLAEFTVTTYTDGLEITDDQLVSRRERVYRALAIEVAEDEEAPERPLPPIDGKSTAFWAYEPLITLWFHYLKRWWVQQSFARFLEQHGLDITKAGVTAPTDPLGAFTRPASADKASLQASVDVTAEAFRSALTRFMREEHLLHTSCDCGYNYYPDERSAAHHSSSDRRHKRPIRAV